MIIETHLNQVIYFWVFFPVLKDFNLKKTCNIPLKYLKE
jgi:hypothetical protein